MNRYWSKHRFYRIGLRLALTASTTGFWTSNHTRQPSSAPAPEWSEIHSHTPRPLLSMIQNKEQSLTQSSFGGILTTLITAGMIHISQSMLEAEWSSGEIHNISGYYVTKLRWHESYDEERREDYLHAFELLEGAFISVPILKDDHTRVLLNQDLALNFCHQLEPQGKWKMLTLLEFENIRTLRLHTVHKDLKSNRGPFWVYDNANNTLFHGSRDVLTQHIHQRVEDSQPLAQIICVLRMHDQEDLNK